MAGEGYKLLTLDLATNTGWCIGPPGGPFEYGSFRCGGSGVPAAERYNELFNFLWRFIDERGRPSEMVYEAPLPHGAREGSTTADISAMLIGFCAIAEMVAHRKGVGRLMKANVQDVRGYFIGKRTFMWQGKPEVGRRNSPTKLAKAFTMQRCEQIGHKVRDDDMADAIALHYWVSAIRFPNLSLPSGPLFDR